MDPITMFLILALLVAIWWLLRKRNAQPATDEDSAPKMKRSNAQFHAVSIKHSGAACQAAIDMAGRRFLASAAPKLPLPECDRLECNCRFAHHDDRRSNKDRRSPFSPGGLGNTTGSYNTEQRSGSDRRNPT